MEKHIRDMAAMFPKLAEFKLRKKNDFTIPRVGKTFEEMVNQKGLANVSHEQQTERREVSDKQEYREESETKDTAGVDEKKEVPQEDELNCDVAREVACAQIVWMIPEVSVEEQPVPETQVGEMAMTGEMTDVLAEAGEGLLTSDNLQMTESTEGMTPETAMATEMDLAPEQIVQTSEEISETEIQTTGLAENNEMKDKDLTENDETADEFVVSEAPLFKDVEAAPIKVAEAPAQAEAPELETQVSDKLVQILESGENRVEIQLNPEALGKMTIELTRSADGTLNVILNAENAETRNMLTRHITTLQETLVDRGQQSVQIEVSRGEETQQQNFQQQDLQDDRNGGHNGQQRRQQESSGEDFLQQLRLGLVDLQGES